MSLMLNRPQDAPESDNASVEAVQSLLDRLGLDGEQHQPLSDNTGDDDGIEKDATHAEDLVSDGRMQEDTVSTVPAPGNASAVSIGEETTPLAEPNDEGTEPFPDYWECETDTVVVDPAHEAAYNYAISKVVEEVIRFKEVDSSIATLPDFGTRDSSQASTLIGASQEAENAVERVASSQHAQEERTNDRPDDRLHLSALGHETELPVSQELIAKLREVLADPILKPALRRRFVSMSNMVLRMHYLMFQKGLTDTHSHPNSFFSSAEDMREVGFLATEIVQYLTILSEQTQEQVDNGYRVAYILSHIHADRSVDTYTRYRRMVQVFLANLQRPRLIEEHLLLLFLDLFDLFVYSDFLRIYNRPRQISLDDMCNNISQRLFGTLIALWNVLNRVVENYGMHVYLVQQMKNQFIAPCMEDLNNSPEIWSGSRNWAQPTNRQVEEQGRSQT